MSNEIKFFSQKTEIELIIESDSDSRYLTWLPYFGIFAFIVAMATVSMDSVELDTLSGALFPTLLIFFAGFFLYKRIKQSRKDAINRKSYRLLSAEIEKTRLTSLTSADAALNLKPLNCDPEVQHILRVQTDVLKVPDTYSAESACSELYTLFAQRIVESRLPEMYVVNIYDTPRFFQLTSEGSLVYQNGRRMSGWMFTWLSLSPNGTFN